ncbi:MAG TPA: hypothetical protein VH165_10190 [Kofleriaceae bacterium]|nr:hypothetical protein [Kofleriaceae bacterium]
MGELPRCARRRRLGATATGGRVALASAALAGALVMATGCGRLGFDVAQDDRFADAGIPGSDAADPGGPTPLHQYRFAGNYKDDYSGPPLVGFGGTFGTDGYEFAPDEGLIATGVVPRTYTIDLEFVFDNVDSWRKIIDFKDLSTDEGLYVYDNCLQFVVVSGTTFQTSPPLLSPRTPARITLSRDAAGTVVGAINGLSVLTFADTAGVGAVQLDTGVTFFVDDSVTNTEVSSGAVSRIRVYNAALAASTLGP